MLTLDYKLDGTSAQFAAIDEGMRVVQFIRNTCLRAWMDRLPAGNNFEAMSGYTAVLEKRVCFCRSVGFPGSASQCWTRLGGGEPLL
jgi:putative transposase